MTLIADVERAIGETELRFSARIGPGEMVAVLGPNGAGKTSLLRTVAGLAAVDAGSISVDGVMLDEPSSATFVAADRRPVGYVFQQYLLFDHLTALDNVAFPLRARGKSRAEARRTALGWLERLGVDAHRHLRPRELSGGQQQRVAVARALACRPRVLLLDEPVAAVDVSSRREIRRELRRHLADFEGMSILVTHDPVDAFALADRVAILESGAVVQEGTLAAVTAAPRSRYVADLVGVNLWLGRTVGDRFMADNGAVLVAADDVPDGPSYCRIHPRSISLHARLPEGSPRNVFEARIAEIGLIGEVARVTLAPPVGLTAEITAAGLAALGRGPGETVWAAVKATGIDRYPA